MNYKAEGNKFHKKIERLLKKAGADIIKSDPNAEGPDIIFTLDDQKVIMQCKNSPKGKKITDLKTLINSYSRLVQKHKAKAAILAFGKYKVPRKIFDKRHQIFEKDKVAIWTDKTIQSYTNLVSSIGRYAKYQIIGDLRLRHRYGTFKVDALHISQKDFTFYVVKLKPSYLMKASFVARRVEDPRTYQRYITRKRISEQIPSYIRKEIGIFPNSVILVSNYPLKHERGKLLLRDAPSSFWILDGQHRVYAFRYVPEHKILDEYEIICSVFDGTKKVMDHNFQTKLFVKINNEAKKIPPSLITDLAESFQGIPFHPRQINIMKKLKTSKMFRGRFKSYKASEGVLNPTTFCTTDSMIRLTRGSTGLIFKNIKRKTSKVEEDRAVKYLENYFKIISSVFRKEWKNPKKYILCSDRGIRGLLNLYEKILRCTSYKDDSQKIKEILKMLKESKPELRLDKLKGLYLGEAGASEMADYFARTINKKMPGFDPSVEEEIQGKIIDSKIFYGKKEKKKAKEYVIKVFRNYFEGPVIGELMYIDKTTFHYFDVLSEKCKKIHLCVQDFKDKRKCSESIRNLREKGIDFIMTKKKLHERWLSTDKYRIDLNTDLKDDAIASKKHTKRLVEINRNNETLKAFKEDWKYYEKMEGDFPKYNYDPLDD
jgi:DGQHR domain-containing protein